MQRLADRLRPGQVGCLLGGTFIEDVKIRRGGTAVRRVRLRSAPRTFATVRGRIEVSDAANYVTLSNLRVDGSVSSENTVQIWGDFVTVSRNNITNRGRSQSCVFIGSRTYGLAYNTVVQRNRIHDCGREGSDLYHGIYAQAALNTRIARNSIYDNAAFGIQLYPAAHRTLVEHNVVNGNGRSGFIYAGDEDTASSNNRVVANAFTWNGRYGIEASWDGPVGTGNVVAGNCLWGNARGALDELDGFTARDNVRANPLYVDRERRDFRFRSESRCRHVGSG